MINLENFELDSKGQFWVKNDKRSKSLSEQHRHECEAREWLKRGYGTKAKIRELREIIRKKRGIEAAESLIAEMRKQYRIRKVK